MVDKDYKRLNDMVKKEIALFMHKNEVNATKEESTIIALAFYRGAEWGIKEMKNRFDDIMNGMVDK